MDTNWKRRFFEPATLEDSLSTVQMLIDHCCDYESAYPIFRIFSKALDKYTYINLTFVRHFLMECGDDLTRFVSPAGGTTRLELFLELSDKMKHVLSEVAPNTFNQLTFPDHHIVNQNLYNRKPANIPLLMQYGREMKFTKSFYLELKRRVVHKMVYYSQYTACLEKLRKLPNKRRLFLLFLVIWTYSDMDKLDEKSIEEVNEAMRLIRRSIPDYFLSRYELYEAFVNLAGFRMEHDKWKRILETYGKFLCDGNFGEFSQPRSLAHLSRCKIRQNLCLNRELPTVVRNFNIPIEIRAYLLLQL